MPPYYSGFNDCWRQGQSCAFTTTGTRSHAPLRLFGVHLVHRWQGNYRDHGSGGADHVQIPSGHDTFHPPCPPCVRAHFPGWRALGRYSLISGALVGFFWLMFLSLRFTQPMNTGVIFTTVPGISGVFSWFLVRERLGGHRLLALALAMTGALWVIFEGNLDRFMALQLNHGDLIFFGGCLMMALYMPLVKLFHRGEPMAMMTLWILVTGSLWLLLFSLPRLSAISWTTIPLFTWLGIAYLAFFTTIITFFISQWATLHLGPTRVMAYSYLYPPLLVALEWGLHRSLPQPSTLIGILIILPAMVIVQRSAATGKP